MKAVVQHYIGTTDEWQTENPVLYEAVWGFEITGENRTDDPAKKRILAKLGNGKDSWNALKYFNEENIKDLPEKLQGIIASIENITDSWHQGDQKLQEQIEQEILERQQTVQELQENIGQETQQRRQAVNELHDADVSLSNAINLLMPEGLENFPFLVEDETKARKLADENLQAQIDNLVVKFKEYPLGSYYTQYPVEGQSTIAGMFPSSESPAELYGGTWTDMYLEDVFFRTGNTLGIHRGQRWLGTSWSNNGTVGVEPDTIRNIHGEIAPIWAGNWAQNGVIDVFDTFTYEGVNNLMVPDTGYMIYGINLMINASRVVPTDNDNHPKNRLLKVWKKTAN